MLNFKSICERVHMLTLAAFWTLMLFLARMNDRVQAQLLLSLESLQAVTEIRSFGIVALLVTCQVIWKDEKLSHTFVVHFVNPINSLTFPLECSIAYLAYESSLERLMVNHVLIENLLLRIGDLTFGTDEQHRTVECEFQPNFASFWFCFLLFRRFFLLFLLRRGAAARASRR